MASPHLLYRSLLHLYPRAFRDHYGDDLVVQFADLVADRGVRAAWTRTGVDLIVTVPRYRLESIMNEQHSATGVNVAITLLAAVGVLTVLTDLLPAPIGLLALVAALALGVAQRSTLARAIRIPDSNRRRRRLGTAGVLAVVFLSSFVFVTSRERWAGGEQALIAIGTLASVGAIVFLVVGLLTPRTRPQPAAPIA